MKPQDAGTIGLLVFACAVCAVMFAPRSESLPPCDAQAAGQIAKPEVKPALPVEPVVKPALSAQWLAIWEANKTGKPIFIHFTDSVTCAPCRKAAELLKTPSVVEALQSFACVEVDRAKDPKLFAWYVTNVGIGTLPCDMVYGKYGYRKWNGLPGAGAMHYVMRLKTSFDYVTTPEKERKVVPQDPPQLRQRGA